MEYRESETKSIEQELKRPSLVEAASFITLSDIGLILRSNWYWFAITLCVAIGGASAYLLHTPNVYKREASILVKDKMDASNVLSELFESSALTSLGGKSAVENELFILKTDFLIDQVIERLNLDVSYSQSRGIRTEMLYKDTPLEVRFVGNSSDVYCKLEVSSVDASHVSLLCEESSIEAARGTTSQVQIGVPQDTPMGRVLVTATEHFPSSEASFSLEVEKNTRERSIRSFSHIFNVSSASKQGSIITLTMQHQNPEVAEDFLNTLVQIYNENSRMEKVRVAQKTEHFIDGRLAIIGGELGSVDTEIEQFKQNNRIADIQQEARSYITGTAEFARQMTEVNNKLAVANYLKDYLKSPSSKDELIPANVGLNEASADNLIREYNSLLLRRDQLIANAETQNPVVETLEKQLASMHVAVVKSVDNLIKSLSVQAASINRQAGLNEGRISSVPMQEKTVGSIYRNQKIKEELYLFLLNAREKNSLAMEAADSEIRLIQPAMGSSIPVAPRKGMILLVAFILGLILPAGVLYLRFIINNKVRGCKDIKSYTSLPFLGEIPRYETQSLHHRIIPKVFRSKESKRHLRQKERYKNILLFNAKERVVISEAFTVVRTNLAYMLHGIESKGKVLMTTSAIPESGKTFISANFSSCLASLEGNRVLLIDADIRKASLSDALASYMTQRSKGGLSSYLLGSSTDLSDLIVRIDASSPFDFLPAGVVPPNPTELLLGDRFSQLIEKVREMYDYILIDSVPFVNVAGALITNRVADMTMVIVREGHLPRPLLLEIEALYRSKKLINPAIVLNDAGAMSGTTGSSYGSYGAYGSYGGYGSYGSYGS